MTIVYGKGAYARKRQPGIWPHQLSKPGPIAVKGSYFRTEKRSGGDPDMLNWVNVYWSENGEYWDPLDFIAAPIEGVDALIEKIRVGFEI